MRIPVTSVKITSGPPQCVESQRAPLRHRSLAFSPAPSAEQTHLAQPWETLLPYVADVKSHMCPNKGQQITTGAHGIKAGLCLELSFQRECIWPGPVIHAVGSLCGCQILAGPDREMSNHERAPNNIPTQTNNAGNQPTSQSNN